MIQIDTMSKDAKPIYGELVLQRWTDKTIVDEVLEVYVEGDMLVTKGSGGTRLVPLNSFNTWRFIKNDNGKITMDAGLGYAGCSNNNDRS